MPKCVELDSGDIQLFGATDFARLRRPFKCLLWFFILISWLSDGFGVGAVSGLDVNGRSTVVDNRGRCGGPSGRGWTRLRVDGLTNGLVGSGFNA